MTNSSKYEFWLCDDAGRKLKLLDKYTFFSYSRAAYGYGTFEIGIPYMLEIQPHAFFLVDRRIDVYRQPSPEFPMRRECSYLIRKYVTYRRQDGVYITVLYGRSPIDLLRRFGGYRADGKFTYLAPWSTISDLSIRFLMWGIARTGIIDDTGSVTDKAGTLPNDFGVEPSPPQTSPNVPTFNGIYSWAGKSALDAINELRQISFAMNLVDPTSNKIYFDVVESPGTYYDVGAGKTTYVIPLPGGFGYEFRTYTGIRGKDRRDNGIMFSVSNENLINPSLSLDSLDEYNDIRLECGSNPELSTTVENIKAEQGSRFNHCIFYSNASDSKAEQMRGNARSLLRKNASQFTISAEFRDSPGGKGSPRSLYGIDWDLGDLVKVFFVGFVFTCEIKIIYVSQDEDGRETVTGRNEIGS